MPKNFAATNARPVAHVLAERQGLAAAPTVSALPQTTAGLADVLSSSEAAPPPPPQPQPQTLSRVRVGGVIVQAKLIHGVPPKYPPAATQLGISGNVVILAHVDKTGSVASMKIVSGPTALQQAAMTALKQWKYQPATLDGVPIETNQTVTIRFQQQ
jgi:periplasmic protein TonB